ncbi:MOSC domain-containing protein [Propylenella binzhouense]|uniref:MOSC domain-containing protein n=1 Tax=Propylenella binzhouense TaxID=2555902 RepID=A0A964WVN9_9HYPH|nr:MOSC N-terminal beta barrel domain-containing protein [Propylenella binzhouense]MYZ50437.1 MOSC domain-containing protein [Propylenella binzhouense]
MQLAAINIYPVKGARGIPLASAALEPRGLAGDRRWMLVDPNGRFISQREFPRLALLGVAQTETGLRLSMGGEAVDVAMPGPGAPAIAATVWGSAVPLREAAEAAEWLSARLGSAVRLGHQPEEAHRAADPAWAEGAEVSLADAFPLLVASPSSLAALEEEAGMAFGMNRFRPNLVIEGAPAWAEDGWARLRVGPVELALVKPCTRCTVTTVDQARGEVAGDEPLATLRRIRMSDDRRLAGVLFGWNAIPHGLGTLRVGDPVEILETRAGWPLRTRPAPGAAAAAGRA